MGNQFIFSCRIFVSTNNACNSSIFLQTINSYVSYLIGSSKIISLYSSKSFLYISYTIFWLVCGGFDVVVSTKYVVVSIGYVVVSIGYVVVSKVFVVLSTKSDDVSIEFVVSNVMDRFK